MSFKRSSLLLQEEENWLVGIEVVGGALSFILIEL